MSAVRGRQVSRSTIAIVMTLAAGSLALAWFAILVGMLVSIVVGAR